MDRHGQNILVPLALDKKCSLEKKPNKNANSMHLNKFSYSNWWPVIGHYTSPFMVKHITDDNICIRAT